MHAKTLGLALLALCPLAVTAQDVDTDPSAAPATVDEYESLLREIRGLEEYNAMRRRQIEQQQVALTRLQTAIDGVPALELQLPPLMIQMVDGLREFIERDIPMFVEDRAQRLTNLTAMLDDAKLSDPAKLRRIFEAWAIEVQYGTEFQTFEGKMPVGNSDRDVDYIAVGRVGLIYQTRDDEALTGAWDSRTNTWVELGTEHRNPVRQAIRMGRNQIAPELVLLPILPPQAN
jgi:hypothetical protein